MRITVARATALVLSALLLSWSAIAPAEAPFPNRALTIVTPYPPGGAGDTTIRTIASFLSKELSQPVIIDNRPGGAAALGLSIAAKAAADGYTLAYAPQIMVVNPHLYKGLPYDTFRDFAPVAKTALLKYVLVVNPEVPARDMSELIEFAKRNPEKLSYGSSGVGNGTHLAGELLSSMTGAKFLHVPYKGEGPALVDVIGGRLSMMFATVATAEPHIRSGKVKALGVASEVRSTLLPHIPTIAETVPGYSSSFWIGLAVPKGTPVDRIAVLNRAVNAVLIKPELRESLVRIGIDPAAPNRPEEFEAFMRSEWAVWGELIKTRGIKGE